MSDFSNFKLYFDTSSKKHMLVIGEIITENCQWVSAKFGENNTDKGYEGFWKVFVDKVFQDDKQTSVSSFQAVLSNQYDALYFPY